MIAMHTGTRAAATAATEQVATQAEEWTRRYLALAGDAGRMYDHVLRRYNELLTRVASGELKPEDVQNEFRAYTQEQSATSTRELVEASVGLLAGLLYLEAKYREAMLDGLLPPDDPIPPPPSPDSIDVANWFTTLSKYAAEQSARSIARQQRLVERISAGEVTADRISEQGRRYLAEHAPHFTNEVVELGMTFAAQMQRSSTQLAEGLYDRVLGPEPGAAEAAEPAPIVTLHGASGSGASAEFVVENTRTVPAHVVCSVSTFVSRATGQAVTAGEVVPSRFTLAPGESQDVAVRVALDRAVFAPSTDYFGILRIAGAGERETIVQLIAHADPERADGAGAVP
jgi:hypothetical protein